MGLKTKQRRAVVIRQKNLVSGLFLSLTVGLGVLVAQLPLCKHECIDANKSGHCHDFVLGASPPCMGTELCMSQDGSRVAGWVHVKVGQCTHSGNPRDQWVTILYFDIGRDGTFEYVCKAYHSCLKGYPHVKPVEPAPEPDSGV